MIKVKESTSSDIFEKAKELLDSQGYTYDYIVKYVVNAISSNDDKWFGIYLANGSADVGTLSTAKEVEDFAKSFINDYVLEKIISAGEDYEYDWLELVNEALEENEEDIDDFNRGFEYLEEEQMNIWQAEEDELNNYYYSTRL